MLAQITRTALASLISRLKTETFISISTVQKPCQHPDNGRDGVGRRLALHVIPPRVVVMVVGVGPSDDGAVDHIGVGSRTVEVVVSLAAGDLPWVVVDGRQRRATVVRLQRVPVPVPNHVAHSHGVLAEEVVHL